MDTSSASSASPFGGALGRVGPNTSTGSIVSLMQKSPSSTSGLTSASSCAVSGLASACPAGTADGPIRLVSGKRNRSRSGSGTGASRRPAGKRSAQPGWNWTEPSRPEIDPRLDSDIGGAAIDDGTKDLFELSGIGLSNPSSLHTGGGIGLVSVTDSLRTVARRLTDYHGLLDRREGMAGVLGGAKPVGPLLLRRFERLFEGPPRVVDRRWNWANKKMTVTWKDIVDHARNRPDQFQLVETASTPSGTDTAFGSSPGVGGAGGADGCVKTCRVEIAGCRVEISEEDYYLIASGMPQRMLATRPVPEDADKEVAAIDALVTSVSAVRTTAEQVTASSRKLLDRLHARRQAIAGRRAQQQQSGNDGPVVMPISALAGLTGPMVTPKKPLSGLGLSPDMLQTFQMGGEDGDGGDTHSPASQMATNRIRARMAAPHTAVDVNSVNGGVDMGVGIGVGSVLGPASATTTKYRAGSSTPSSVDGDPQPFRPLILARNESVRRGCQMVPPCDRCRRLNMACIKNLTACLGCTKKHGKCSWWDVRPAELVDGVGVSVIADAKAGTEQLATNSGTGLVATTNGGPGATGRVEANGGGAVVAGGGGGSSAADHVLSGPSPPSSSADCLGPAAFSYSADISLALPTPHSLGSDSSGASALAVLGDFGISPLTKYAASGVDVVSPSVSAGQFGIDTGHLPSLAHGHGHGQHQQQQQPGSNTGSVMGTGPAHGHVGGANNHHHGHLAHRPHTLPPPHHRGQLPSHPSLHLHPDGGLKLVRDGSGSNSVVVATPTPTVDNTVRKDLTGAVPLQQKHLHLHHNHHHHLPAPPSSSSSSSLSLPIPPRGLLDGPGLLSPHPNHQISAGSVTSGGPTATGGMTATAMSTALTPTLASTLTSTPTTMTNGMMNGSMTTTIGAGTSVQHGHQHHGHHGHGHSGLPHLHLPHNGVGTHHHQVGRTMSAMTTAPTTVPCSTASTVTVDPGDRI